MKFLPITLENGQSFNLNLNMVKGFHKDDSTKGILVADLIGNNPPIRFKGSEDCVHQALEIHELTMRSLPVLVAAILQSPLLQAVINQGNGKILAGQIVEEARSLLRQMISQEITAEELDIPVDTDLIFEGKITVKQEGLEPGEHGGLEPRVDSPQPDQGQPAEF